MTLQDSLLKNCDRLFLQRVDAAASFSIFNAPISVTNGVTVSVPAPGTSGLTFKVNSDDLGLGKLIVPGFDVLFTGKAVKGDGGTPESVVWTASVYPQSHPSTVNFQLANTNSLALDIEAVRGTVTTALFAVAPPAPPDGGKVRAEKTAILLEGPWVGDELAISTSFGPVTVALDKIQLVALERSQQVATSQDSAGAPTFTVKLKPAVQGTGGEFRIAGMSAPFNMKLVGADEAWSCHVQLQGTPGLVTVTLLVSRDDGKDPKITPPKGSKPL